MNVIMLHSVGNTNNQWYRNWLSVSLTHFGNFCFFLKNKNYRTILLDEWYYLQDNPKEIIGNEVVLTFDDGYLDNWVFAYPILKKYSLCGTIFVNPEFVDPGEKIRPNQENFPETITENCQSLGFLNWEEIKTLEASNVFDIQSHCMSHNFFFNKNKIVDIYTGQPNYDWLHWISRPDRKPFYINESQESYTAKGTPIFEYYRSLGVRRYFPDPVIAEKAIYLWNKNKKCKKIIIKELNEEIKKHPGRFESDNEMEYRYRYEIFESKRILESKLKKKVNYLCWPGGGYNDLSIKLSIEAGYKASTLASRERNMKVNNTLTYKRIKRFGMGSYIVTSKKNHLVKSKNYLIERFLGRTGNKLYRNISRARKIGCMIKDMFSA